MKHVRAISSVVLGHAEAKMPGKLDDKQVRLAAFQWLGEQVALHGDVLPRSLLLQGFELDGRRVPLGSVQGRFMMAAQHYFA